ncbi:MAG: SET domain-containing protein [Sediminibacterium sp.]|jgi:SET domain-containing protein|nr:SET domain-containing protein [Hydrotalea sp.]MCU0337860.1 SET domain-containing protein [Sediminibacterium sp.]
MILPSLFVAPSELGGRGVFTAEDLDAGLLIEVSPVLVLSEEERAIVEKTELNNYIFAWGEDDKQAVVAWGYVSIYNHSYEPNCRYEMDMEDDWIRIVTLKPISLGTELTINYLGDDPKLGEKVWFEAK